MFDGREEGVGVEQSVFGVVPADERFDAADVAVGEVELWLVVQNELPGVDRVRELTEQG